MKEANLNYPQNNSKTIESATIESLRVDEQLTEQARVLSRENGALWVAADRRSTCGACKAKSGCGTALYAKLGAEQVVVRAILPKRLEGESFAENDWVELAVDRLAFVRMSLFLYMLPLAGLFAAVLASQGAGEFRLALAALFGLYGGGALAKLWLKYKNQDYSLQPVVLNKITPSSDEQSIRLVEVATDRPY